MKRLAFAFAGAAALTLAGCNSSNQDQVNNAELNQPTTEELNQAASDAANDAANAEAAALGQQEQQLEANNANTDDASDEQEQNVAGM
jgi:predicted component of type VI protein secretion system